MTETVYHYCSMSTFTSIMRNRSIWLTTLRDSNDSLEGTWARRIFEYHRTSPASDYFKKASYVLDCATQSGKDVVGICFSSESDLLSQWRGYADNGQGFSIGFSVAALESIAQKINASRRVNLELAQIEYTSELSGDFLRDFKVFVDKQEYSSGEKFVSLSIDNIGLQHWVRRVCLMKNIAFEEEKESRLFTLFPDSDSKILGYRQAGNKLSRYLELSLEENLGDIITSVVIGPRNASDRDHIRDFVAKSGFSNVYDVSKSRASYR